MIAIGCSKEQQTYTSKLSAIYALPHYTYEGGYAELDINGKTITVTTIPKKGGISSEPFELPEGNNRVTRINIYDNNAKLVYKVLSMDRLGDMNGLVVTGVPFETWGGNVTGQIFFCDDLQ